VKYNENRKIKAINDIIAPKGFFFLNLEM